jgi:tetratricopeptide (TPR) repeat protein
MSSQSIWFAYDPQWASSIRTRLNEIDISDLWLLENVPSIQTPRITHDKYLGNPIQQMTSKKSSENELSYDPLRGDHQTIESLNSFLQRQCWRSAVDWTTNYLLKNPHDYHIWFIRFACLIKLRLFPIIENEFETFGNLNSYTKFPFSLRLLHAELPIYMDSNRFHDGLDRLFRLLMMTNTILSILPKDQIQLWQKRRLRILYSIANCYILMKRIDSIISIIENQIIKNENIEQQIELYLLIVRILLQTGDELNAQRAFDRALSLLPSKENLPNEFLITKELFSLFRNEFSTNKLITSLVNPVETNNHCVILLYMSKMKESLDLYEKLIRNKSENIHEAIIYNICTIYELESFRFTQKKHDLIDYMSQSIGDGFSLTALKLQT